MNDAVTTISPASSHQTVGNCRIVERDRTSSLDVMWREYRRSLLKGVQNCAICRTNLSVIAPALVYTIEKRGKRSGEGVDAAATTTFSYSHDDQRIKKTSGGVDTIYVNAGYPFLLTPSPGLLQV